MFQPTSYDVRIQIVAVIGALALVLSVIELVRRRRLGESYSIAWLLLSAVIVVFALFRDLQDVIAALVGVYYPPSLLFGLLIFMLLGIVLYLSLSLTRVELRTRILAQRLALLEYEMSVTKRLSDGGGPSGAA
jgi:hypothetical protein